MKKIVLFSFLVLFAFPSMAQLIDGDSVVFQNLGQRLILYKDGRFVELENGCDILRTRGLGDDTISYGKYVIHKKEIYLYSDSALYSQELPITVERQATNNDNYTIIVSSPYTKAKKHYSYYLEDTYFYSIEVTEIDTASGMTVRKRTFTYSDTITLPKTTGLVMKKIFVRIYPFKPPCYTRGGDNFPYLFFSYNNDLDESDLFYVSCPKHTPMYNRYVRYDGFILEILAKDVLVYDRSSFLENKDCKSPSHVSYRKIKKHLTKDKLNPYEESLEFYESY